MRPADPNTRFSFTPYYGIPFQWLTDDIRDRGAKDANSATVHALVSWQDADLFLEEAVGFTVWDGSRPTLQRVLPLACPTRADLWCDTYEMVRYGAYESRTDFSTGAPDYLPVQDWCRYALTFTRPKFDVLSDAQLAAAPFASREQFRYTTFSRRYVPRERRQSGYAFEYLPRNADGSVPDPTVSTNWKTVPDEAFFQADYQIEYVVGFEQIPIAAVPEAPILAQLLTVNSTPFTLGQTGNFPTFQPGTLLFKGPQADVQRYQGADGGFYEDMYYVFAFQRGNEASGDPLASGWNAYPRPDMTGTPPNLAIDYGPVRRRNGRGTQPRYAASEFQRLFQPGNS